MPLKGAVENYFNFDSAINISFSSGVWHRVVGPPNARHPLSGFFSVLQPAFVYEHGRTPHPERIRMAGKTNDRQISQSRHICTLVIRAGNYDFRTFGSCIFDSPLQYKQSAAIWAAKGLFFLLLEFAATYTGKYEYRSVTHAQPPPEPGGSRSRPTRRCHLRMREIDALRYRTAHNPGRSGS